MNAPTSSMHLLWRAVNALKAAARVCVRVRTLALAFALGLGALPVACGDGSGGGGEDASIVDTGADGDAIAPHDTTQPPDDVVEEVIGVTHCDNDTDCDDGLACTTDACADVASMGRICQWTVVANACLAGGVCRQAGEADPNEPCRVCDPAAPTRWTVEADGEACDDGDACTSATTCTAGVCGGGSALACDDGNPCTTEACDPAEGCVSEPVSNTLALACDDGLGCTENDVCVDGECGGATLDCDDDNACTDDACVEGTGCTHTNNTAACEDGDPCTVDSVCADGTCGGGQPNTCDDANQCTIDVCYQDTGCAHLPTYNPCCTGTVSVCEDNDPCTTDLCDPDTAECSYALNTAPCNDHNACTTGDTCDQGTCTGATLDCSDGNDCSADTCNVNIGCVHTALDSGTCDDGLSCSTGDSCVAGVCTADMSQCLCTPSFGDAVKVTALAVGTSSGVGEALDVDGDGDRDNALAPLGSIVNTPLSDAVTSGGLMLMLEGFTPGTFAMALHNGELDAGNASCDYQTATCDYLASRDLLDPVSCEPTVTLQATWANGQVTGGGPSTTLPFALPVGTSSMQLTLYMAAVSFTTTEVGGEVAGLTGILAGAARETDLNAAIRQLDPAALGGMTPDAVIGLLATLSPNDIDTNGDGTRDAKSIGLKVTAIDGRLVGAATP